MIKQEDLNGEYGDATNWGDSAEQLRQARLRQLDVMAPIDNVNIGQ